MDIGERRKVAREAQRRISKVKDREIEELKEKLRKADAIYIAMENDFKKAYSLNNGHRHDCELTPEYGKCTCYLGILGKYAR